MSETQDPDMVGATAKLMNSLLVLAPTGTFQSNYQQGNDYFPVLL